MPCKMGARKQSLLMQLLLSRFSAFLVVLFFSLVWMSSASAQTHITQGLGGFTPNPEVSISFEEDKYRAGTTQPAHVSITGARNGSYTVNITDEAGTQVASISLTIGGAPGSNEGDVGVPMPGGPDNDATFTATFTINDRSVTDNATLLVYALSMRFLKEKVAVGAVDDEAHQAGFEIRATDADGDGVSGVEVNEPQVTSGGRGPESGISAIVEVDGGTTDDEGRVQGTFTSGNRTETTTIAVEGGPSASISQVWSELSDEETWEFEPYFDYDEASTITFNMAYTRDGQQVPITGHELEPTTTAISGFEWNPDIGEDWDEDGTVDGDYETASYSEDDEDTSGFDEWSDLVEWGSVSEDEGSYTADQTIKWDEDFIVDSVYFWMWDNSSYGPDGSTG